ncbi:hypothetical protein PYCC9005_003471 [Savitreella phatthalungensis]
MTQEKRKRPENGHGSGNGKSAKRFQFDKAGSLTPGARGCFVTCVRGKEMAAQKDVLLMFERHLERYPDLLAESVPENTGDDAQKEEDNEEDADDESAGGVENEYESELKALQQEAANDATKTTQKGPPPKRTFTPLRTNVECVLFIKFDRRIDPTVFVFRLMEDKYKSPREVVHGRFTRRMTPISGSADASLDGLKRALSQALPSVFSGDTGLGFRVDVDARCNDQLTRDQIIPATAAAVREIGGDHHKVQLKGHDVAINITLIRGYLGVGIVRESEKLKRYNPSEIHVQVLAQKETTENATGAQAEVLAEKETPDQGKD